ncbi:sulfatase [Aestuariibaculum sediminum]|uniref:Sulfatase n=1 Tax=Aestuariibaculum sediminum TaxID=2770637 RepID=A0A8J6UBL7_9FLAO|nr:sulfatase [Aestuariibaculum sediminum]MBD0830999.1 sulfatase [Aestuariibaculum sediminum]
MKSKLLILVLVVYALSSIRCTPSTKKQKPNILLICIDDLRPELKSFGADYIISPNIDKLAKNGASFQKHFVNAPSCGPSRYTLLTGQYGPASNNAFFVRKSKLEQKSETINPTMPEWFRMHGYTTVSVGKVSHHPGGRGGTDWNDSTKIEIPKAWDKHLMPVADWQHPRGAMHGLAHGEIRMPERKMDVFQSAEGTDNIYPDGAITNEALKQLYSLTNNKEKPFFLAVGLIKPHLPFGAPKPYYDAYKDLELPEIEHPEKPDEKTTWHSSGEFMKYNRWGKDPNQDKDFADEVRRHYAACVSYADAQVGKVLEALKHTGANKNTIIVLWGDHGWHLGEHAIWGKHSLFEESLRSPLIIQYPEMKHKGLKSDALVETLDIFPTLCELTGVNVPEFTQGTSLTDLLTNKTTTEHYPIAYTGNATTIRTKTHRLTLHKDGFVELYDETSEEKETKNIAEQFPYIVQQLKQSLKEKLK